MYKSKKITRVFMILLVMTFFLGIVTTATVFAQTFENKDDNIFTRWNALTEKEKKDILSLFEKKCELEIKIIDRCVKYKLLDREMGDKLQTRIEELREECIENRMLPPLFFPRCRHKSIESTIIGECELPSLLDPSAIPQASDEPLPFMETEPSGEILPPVLNESPANKDNAELKLPID